MFIIRNLAARLFIIRNLAARLSSNAVHYTKPCCTLVHQCCSLYKILVHAYIAVLIIKNLGARLSFIIQNLGARLSSSAPHYTKNLGARFSSSAVHYTKILVRACQAVLLITQNLGARLSSTAVHNTKSWCALVKQCCSLHKTLVHACQALLFIIQIMHDKNEDFTMIITFISYVWQCLNCTFLICHYAFRGT